MRCPRGTSRRLLLRAASSFVVASALGLTFGTLAAGSSDPASVPEDVHPLKLETVGRYALQIDWSDGHSTGIYPFRRLRELG